MGIAVWSVGAKYRPGSFIVIPQPSHPQFLSAEVGTVNASTVAVTFDQSVDASGSDYSSGVTITVNGSTAAFESGIRQSNHAIVYYALSTPVAQGDTVTWEYSKASGAIVGESGGLALGDVSAQSVTNDVSGGDPIGNGLRADAIGYWKMDYSGATALKADAKGYWSMA